MHKVRLSAKILTFPGKCCCCAQFGATEKYAAVATRTTGKRVVRTDSRSWSFPVCVRCLRWIAADRLATGFGTIFFLFTIGFISVAYGYRDKPKELIPNCGIGALIFVGLAVLWRWSRTRSIKMKPDPSCGNPPVKYLGWQGTVHTFILSNQTFSAEFEQANVSSALHGKRKMKKSVKSETLLKMKRDVDYPRNPMVPRLIQQWV
jgi:hypothetical protein